MVEHVSLLMASLLTQTAAPPDTVIAITRTGWVATMANVSQAVVSIAMLAVLVAGLLALVALRKSIHELQKLMEASYGDLSALARRANQIADNVQDVTSSIRVEIDNVRDTVRDAQDRVRNGLDGAEERVRRLAALVDVAQEEAEDFVVSTASALRGVRTGASVLKKSLAFVRGNGHRNRRRRRQRARERADDDRPRIRSRVANES
jgi:gas vesicle protein